MIPADLSEIFPFIATLVFILFTSIIEILMGIGIKKSPADFSIPLLSVFLGLSEGIGIGYAVLISTTSILSFYAMVIIFYTVKERIGFFSQESGLKTYCVLLICLAFMMIAICGFNVSWFYIYLDGGAK